MLPPNALRHLKDHPEGIVFVLLATISAGGGYAAGGLAGIWAGVAALAVGGGLYHIRCNGSERNRIELRRLELDEKALEIEVVKAPHRALLLPPQQSLPLRLDGKNVTGQMRPTEKDKP